ncbi:MAG TPA: lipoyl domain-containing protein [Terriglobales bacterium]|nr:lipoyl domain-containing protein [Terriglobales bacterium]
MLFAIRFSRFCFSIPAIGSSGFRIRGFELVLVKRQQRNGGVAIVTTLKVPKTGGIPTTKASVLRWLKREGEPVLAGEAVVELETEKVSYELESPISGTVLKILAEESSQVPVGGKLCHIGQEGESTPKD